MEADRVALVGAVRSAMPGTGQAPQRPRRPDTPHPQGWALLAASRVARRLLYLHNGATRALLAVKIVPVKWVNSYDLWYDPPVPPMAPSAASILSGASLIRQSTPRPINSRARRPSLTVKAATR